MTMFVWRGPMNSYTCSVIAALYWLSMAELRFDDHSESSQMQLCDEITAKPRSNRERRKIDFHIFFTEQLQRITTNMQNILLPAILIVK